MKWMINPAGKMASTLHGAFIVEQYQNPIDPDAGDMFKDHPAIRPFSIENPLYGQGDPLYEPRTIKFPDALPWPLWTQNDAGEWNTGDAQLMGDRDALAATILCIAKHARMPMKSKADAGIVNSLRTTMVNAETGMLAVPDNGPGSHLRAIHGRGEQHRCDLCATIYYSRPDTSSLDRRFTPTLAMHAPR